MSPRLRAAFAAWCAAGSLTRSRYSILEPGEARLVRRKGRFLVEYRRHDAEGCLGYEYPCGVTPMDAEVLAAKLEGGVQ